MVRQIKRYGSRKLYDTQESRYVSLEDLAAWVREGQEIQVIDNASSEDATVATLTQVISEEGRKGSAFLPSDLLHNLIRVGGQAVSSRVRKFQSGVDRLVKSSIDHLVPVSGVREEMQLLRQRLDELESALSQSDAPDGELDAEQVPAKPRPTKTTRSKVTKTVTRKAATEKEKPKQTAATKQRKTRATRAATTAKTSSKTTAGTTKAKRGADS